MKRLFTAALLLLTSEAYAVSFTTSLGVTVGIPGNNDFQPFFTGLGFTDMLESGVLSVDAAAILTYEFLGKEAGFNNTFFANGSLLFSNADFGFGFVSPFQTAFPPNSVIGSYGSYSTGVAAGVLDFAFGRNGMVPTETNALNSLSVSGVDPNIAFILSANRDVAYILYDDFGFGIEDNHDDMVVRLTARAIPEPASLLLMASALGVLGACRRKKPI